MKPYIFFDAGNTLVLPDTQRIAAVSGRALDLKILRRLGYRVRIEMEERMLYGGTEGIDVFIDLFSTVYERAAGVPRETAGQWARQLKDMDRQDDIFSHVNEEAPGVLEQLKQAGIRMSVISNADGRIEQLLQRVGLRHYFDRVYDSHIVGLEKPDVRFFQKALTELKCIPSESFYIGDLLHIDYLPSTASGMNGLLYDPYDHYDLNENRIRSLAEIIDRCVTE